MNKNLRRRLTATLCCAWGTTAHCSLSTSSRASDLDVPAKTVPYQDLDSQGFGAFSRPGGTAWRTGETTRGK